MMQKRTYIPINLIAKPDWEIRNYPVELGIPFPKGEISNLNQLQLFSTDDSPIACDLTETLRWPDGSIRWGMLRFLASQRSFFLRSASTASFPLDSCVRISEIGNEQRIDTGAASFGLATDWFSLSSELSGLIAPELLMDVKGHSHRFRIESWTVEHCGNVSVVFLLKGSFVNCRNRILCKGECRISFWAGTALVRIEFTLWNPRAARHKGGIWDLGDPGSVFFRSLHVTFRISTDNHQSQSLYLSVTPGDEVIESQSGPLSIHQSSSGGTNWQSLAHVDKNNTPTPKFKGYQCYRGQSKTTGLRANPAAIYRNAELSAAFALEDFWQRFPSRLEIRRGYVSVEPFPSADCQEFELQGGEKATFRLWADFDCKELSTALLPSRIHITPVIPVEWHRVAGSISGLSGGDNEADPWFDSYVRTAVRGPNSFFERRDSYEEYGWRNYGDLPADHEQLHFNQDRQLVSHYNNQYDLVQGFLTQFAATGDDRWFELARDLARHVIDHDIYHTNCDKSAYNGGYFWHTAHYLHAGTSTHRSFSKLAADPLPKDFGGGPANEHNYTTGLMYYFLMSGDVRAKEAVIQLASWVRDMQDGWKTPFRFLSRNETGLATCTADLMFQGPGRGGAYSINACLDAFTLTSDPQWLVNADEFIKTCIHPSDDPVNRHLLDREGRWSYVIFLQVLGKYLDLKMEIGELDREFHFGREALLKYARWMAKAEYPYLDHPEELEYPTSTWAAQELRKACVFLFAAKYGLSAESGLFFEKAEYFLTSARRYLESFEDKTSTRNMALVLLSAPMYFHLRETSLVTPILQDVCHDFGEGLRLIPQKIDAMRKLRRVVKTCGLSGILELIRYARDCFAIDRSG